MTAEKAQPAAAEGAAIPHVLAGGRDLSPHRGTVPIFDPATGLRSGSLSSMSFTWLEVGA
jgi:hypothetical protein